ncbi:hypothetical protein HOY80DRAFT_1138627 [Tuber brumale]|nr:hypothetical protein HOY80DRAFT_1138627 [Tuber brumale]
MPTAASSSSLGPVITRHPRIPIPEDERMLVLEQESIISWSLGTYKSARIPLTPSTMIRSTFEKGRAHPRATIIHPIETLAVGDIFGIN